MTEFINLILVMSAKMGYPGIVLLMTIESSFIPFPSEIIIPPAAYLASLKEMDIILVVFSGILGSLIGATINYYLAMTLGRKIVFSLSRTKIAKLFLINENKIIKAEEYFLKHGKMSTFIGRLIPGIRQLISLPAGFSKMNFKSFIFYTFLGSASWVIILAVLGYSFGANQEILSKHYKEMTILLILISLIIILFYFSKKNINKK